MSLLRAIRKTTTTSRVVGNWRFSFLLRSTTNAAGTSDDGPTGKKIEHSNPVFYVPRHERGDRPVYEIDHMVGETRLMRTDRLCPTRELYFLHTQWGRHKSPYRKFRHMANLFRSAPFQRLIFPDFCCLTLVASALTYFNEVIVTSTPELVAPLTMTPSAFAGATTAIGLLAGFRLNASYGRYREGRQVWSDVQTSIRDLARQTKMFLGHEPQAQQRMLRLCQAFPVALLFHLNDKGCHHSMKRLTRLGDQQFYDRVYAEFRAELYDVYRPFRNDQPYDSSNSDTIHNALLRTDFERICQVKSRRGHVPLEVLTCMSETIAGISTCNQSNTKGIHPVLVQELDEKVQRLCKAMGGGERILKTPVPTAFTRHSSRLLFIWSNCLPFALYPILGPWGTLPTTLLTAYAVLGIEDISVQLEEPFDILNLREFSNTMYDSVQAIEKSYTRTNSIA